MAEMPKTLSARFTIHLTKRRSWSFALPVARLHVARPESRVVDGQAVASVPVTLTMLPSFKALALAVRVAAFVLRCRVDVECG